MAHSFPTRRSSDLQITGYFWNQVSTGVEYEDGADQSGKKLTYAQAVNLGLVESTDGHGYHYDALNLLWQAAILSRRTGTPRRSTEKLGLEGEGL